MNSLFHSLLEQWAQSAGAMRLGSAVLYFVWQGSVLAAIAWAILAMLQRARPQLRYLVLLATLAALVACPVVTFVTVVVAAETKFGDSSRDSAPAHRSTVSPADRAESGGAALIPVAPRRVSWNDELTRVEGWLEQHRPWIAAGWLAGVCLLSLRLTVGLIGAERVRRRAVTAIARSVHDVANRLASRMGIRGTVRVLESTLAEVPTLVGWLRPAILLPVSAVNGLTASQMEAILAHELAHVVRHDYLVNLLQTVVETVLFYHPAVWWISRRIRQEREHCCDDVAAALCADRVGYARALTAMEELRAPSPRWVVAAQGGSLVERIRRLVGRPEPSGSGKLAFAAVAALVTIVAGVTLSLRQPAYAEDDDKPAKTSAAQGEKPPDSAASSGADDPAQEKSKRPRDLPWSVFGRVTDAQGRPLAGVVVTAHAGMGTLRPTGKAETDADGEYAFDFGPGIAMAKNNVQLQAATITARKPGFSEKNLSRQGDFLAAFRLPEEDVGWGKKKKEDVILPGKPRQIDFVMLPAAKVSGTLIDKDRQPLAGYSVALTGEELPPGSSVLASIETDGQGRFTLAEIPTGFKWQFLIEPARRQSPWNAWASGMFLFLPESGGDDLFMQQDATQLLAKQFNLQVIGNGVNWRAALKIGADHQTLSVIGNSVVKQSRVHAASVRLVLNSSEAAETEDSGAAQGDKSTTAKGISKSNLKRTKPDAEGRFTVSFDNPLTRRDAARWTLDPEKHQVVFQIFVRNAGNELVEKVLRQLPARESGEYRVDVQVPPELIDHSSVSVTFLTIQPEHDKWVKAFFEEGRKTTYSGIWAGDGGRLAQVPLDDRKTDSTKAED